MADDCAKVRTVQVEALTAEGFAPFGRILGAPLAAAHPERAFAGSTSDFWHALDFDPGPGGTTEVLWVNYRDDSRLVRRLEAHWLTEQAIIPLGAGEIIHVVCPARGDDDRLPDLGRLRAFRVPSGWGICMRPACWHASFVSGAPATCLMLTRASTTRELVAHLKTGTAAAETGYVDLERLGEAAISLLDRPPAALLA